MKWDLEHSDFMKLKKKERKHAKKLFLLQMHFTAEKNVCVIELNYVKSLVIPFSVIKA